MKIVPTLFAATVLPPVVAVTLFSIGLLTAATAFAYAKGRHEAADRRPSVADAPEKAGARRPESLTPDNASLRTALHLTSYQDRLWREAERSEWLARGSAPPPGSAAVGESEGLTPGKDDTRREAGRQNWQAVYESLNAEQRERAASFLSGKLGESAGS